MAQKERLDLIRQAVQRDRKVSVSELSKIHAVTEETIRRDLEKLEKEGLVNRTYGGAVLNIETISEHIHYVRRREINKDAKNRIAQLTLPEISANAVIGADASSTVMQAVSCLKERSDVSILTNSVQIVRDLDQSSINIISTGGAVNRNTCSMQGSIVRKVLSEYYVDIVLISCTALELDGGVFDANEEEAELKKVLIERGRKIILLVDHTKFNKVAFVKLLDFSQLDMIITDQEPSEEWKEKFRQINVELRYPAEN
ncbi:MAG: DeoR/GlpR family DNA-binding transcription regulator [Clostridiales bacterium]|nr:DeoR/GlpR family DNA-binding transcription regulator [Clostridiales bacterium]